MSICVLALKYIWNVYVCISFEIYMRCLYVYWLWNIYEMSMCVLVLKYIWDVNMCIGFRHLGHISKLMHTYTYHAYLKANAHIDILYIFQRKYVQDVYVCISFEIYMRCLCVYWLWNMYKMSMCKMVGDKKCNKQFRHKWHQPISDMLWTVGDKWRVIWASSAVGFRRWCNVHKAFLE
jgi:hypothetical protein